MNNYISRKYKLVLFLLSALLFIAIPAKRWISFNGLPLNHPADIFFIIFLFGLFFVVRWKADPPKSFKKVTALLICLILLKAFFNISTIQHGLKGYYYNSKDFGGECERSTEFRGLDATRIDEEISFYNIGYSLKKRPFNVWFFNKDKSGNYDFSAIWKGHLYVPEECKTEFFLISSGSPRLYIDNKPVLERRNLFLTEGFHDIEVKYAGKSIQDDMLDLGWSMQGREETISSYYLYPSRPGKTAFLMDKYLGFFSPIIFFLQFIPLFFIIKDCLKKDDIKKLIKDENFLLFSFFILLVAHAFITLLKHSSSPIFNVLSRGDDWLTYEMYARSIVFGDWLVKREAPFYYVPFYRYFLAIVHMVLGESIFMARWVQFFLISSASIFVYKIAKKIFNTNVAVMALLLFAFTETPNLTARLLLTEPLATFFGCMSVYYLISFLDDRRLKSLFVSGISLGFASITRPNLFSYMFFVIPWLYIFLKKERFMLVIKYLLIFFVGVMIIVSCVTLRNYLLSDRFVLFNDNFSATLRMGNYPPVSVDLGKTPRNHIYKSFGVDGNVRAVLEYARQEPVLFIKHLGVKLAYIAGVDPHNLSKRNEVLSIDKFLIFVLFILGFFRALHSNKYKLRKSFVAVAIFPFVSIATLVAILPWVYGWRLQLPAIPFMMIFVAYFLDKLLVREIQLKDPLFYMRYILLMVAFFSLTLEQFFPFICVIYSIFYYRTVNISLGVLPSK